MADTRDLKSLALKGVRVRVSLAAPKQEILKEVSCFFYKIGRIFLFYGPFFYFCPGGRFLHKIWYAPNERGFI